MAKAGNGSEKRPSDWLQKQAPWQVYLPPPTRSLAQVRCSQSKQSSPSWLTFFSHTTPLDRWRGRKTYKYVLTVVDVASLKVAEPVTSKEAKEIAGAFQRNREFKIEERGRRQARPEVRITIWSSLRITKMSTLPRVGALLFSTDVIQRCSALLVKREYFDGLYSFFLSFFFHCLGVCRKCKVF